MDAKEAASLDTRVWTMLEECVKYSVANSANISSDKNLMDFFRSKVAETKLSSNDKKLLLQTVHSWGAYTGTSIDRQSLKFLWIEEGFDEGT